MTDTQTLPQAAPEAQSSLTARVVRGAAWVFLGKLIGRGMQLARIVVLARVLAPHDFGLFGIVMLAIATVQTFTQTGFSTALVQRRGDTDSYLDTAWTVGLVRGFVLAAIIYAGAPLVGAFFGEPRVVPLLRVMCVGVALGGLTNIGTVYFQKELQFHKQVIWSSAAAFVSLVVGVVLAYRLRSVWALVWSGLAGNLASCALSYAIHPYRPRLRFSAARARELHGFGRWVFVSGVLTLVIVQGDDAFLGKVLGAAALGLYQVAYRLSNAAATEIAHTVTAVAFPAYSAIQDDTVRLRSALFRTLALTLLLLVPVAAVMAGLAPALVGVVFGAKWAGMVVPIQVLCAFSILRGYGASVSSALYATGNPREQAKTALLNVLVLVACVYPLTTAWGIPGTCVAVLLAILPAKVYASWRLAGVVQAAPAKFARALAAPLLAGAVAYAAGHLYVAATVPSLPGLVLGGIVAGLAYVAALGVLRLCGFPLPVDVARPAVLRAWAAGRA